MARNALTASWLIQRLEAPRPNGAPANPFSFGGGYRNGGLTDEGAAAVGAVFSFDYMGAAEFEFGALPKALSKMFEARKHLTASTIAVGDATAYLLCERAHRDECAERITAWAGGREQLKEATRMVDALNGADRCRTVGWLELDNGFMFTIDPTMWRGMCALFGVDCPAEVIA